MIKLLNWFGTKVEKSAFVKKFYGFYFYIGIGRNEVNRYLNDLPQLAPIFNFLILMGFVFDVWVYPMIFITVLLVFSVIGFVFKHARLYDHEQKINAKKNPVGHEQYEAAKWINANRERLLK